MSDPKLTFTLTQRLKPAVQCSNGFSYVGNGTSKEFNRFRCSLRACNASLKTRVSDNALVGDTLPSHTHGNGLLRRAEDSVIEKYSAGIKPKHVLIEMRTNMLGSVELNSIWQTFYNLSYILLRTEYTLCPESSDPFYIVSYYINWVTTSWTYSINKDNL